MKDPFWFYRWLWRWLQVAGFIIIAVFVIPLPKKIRYPIADRMERWVDSRNWPR